MTKLTATQVEELNAPSTKYPVESYKAALKQAVDLKGASRIEADFPGVKPQHVAHMLKGLIKPTQKFRVVISATLGVCVTPSKPAARKPAAVATA